MCTTKMRQKNRHRMCWERKIVTADVNIRSKAITKNVQKHDNDDDDDNNDDNDVDDNDNDDLRKKEKKKDMQIK